MLQRVAVRLLVQQDVPQFSPVDEVAALRAMIEVLVLLGQVGRGDRQGVQHASAGPCRALPGAAFHRLIQRMAPELPTIAAPTTPLSRLQRMKASRSTRFTKRMR